MLPPNLDHLSPFEVAIGRKAILAPKFEYKPTIPITGTHVQAKEKLDEKIENILGNDLKPFNPIGML